MTLPKVKGQRQLWVGTLARTPEVWDYEGKQVSLFPR